MDSISNLFRINLVTVASRTAPNGILKNYDLITDFQVTFRDLSTNQAHQINQVRLRINGLNEVQVRPEPSEIHKQLHSVVFDESQKYEISSIIELIDTPWYERWKDTFLHHHHLYNHDFIGANFGVIVLVGVADLNSFDEEVSRLLASVRESIQPKMMTSYIEHYVVVDDDQNSSLPANGEEIPQSYRKAYDRFVNCFGAERCSWLSLTQSKHQNIVQFLQNFITRNLIPWCEHQVRFLNDAISSRKGLGLNLFNATRQFLGQIGPSASSAFVGVTSVGGNSGTGGAIIGAQQSVVYASDAVELQCRKLADIAMCLGLYELAATNYDRARREFYKDSAWFHYAGSCEAYAAAQFMQNKFHKISREYIEKAVATYMDACRSIDLATRATILATDILRKIAPADAAKFFVSLTGDDSNLRSALFLEQASRCYSLCQTRHRKAAFHYVLAGYRYSQCGLRALSLRCYSEFKAHDWSAAAQHVGVSIERIQRQIINNPCTIGAQVCNAKLTPEIGLFKHSCLSPTFDFDILLIDTCDSQSRKNDLTKEEHDFFSGEMFKFCITQRSLQVQVQDLEKQCEQKLCLSTEQQDSWTPGEILLYSNGDIWSENGVVNLLKGERRSIQLKNADYPNSAMQNVFQLRVPSATCKHVIYFKFDYYDMHELLRHVVKTVTFNVKPSVQLLSIKGPVISIKNIFTDKFLFVALICQNDAQLSELWHNSSESIQSLSRRQDQSDENLTDLRVKTTEIPPNMIAHLLMKQNHSKCTPATVFSSSVRNKNILLSSCQGDDQLLIRWRTEHVSSQESQQQPVNAIEQSIINQDLPVFYRHGVLAIN